MNLNFMDFEIPLLKVLVKLGGKGSPGDVYLEVERTMGLNATDFPEEYGKYKSGAIKWKNKPAWAREYLKRKGQLDGSERGIWKITEIGKEQLNHLNKTQKDPDEGLAPLLGVDASMSDENISPEEGFNKIENIQVHETGGILGVRGIVYEPINEQGVILLFAALCHELGFMIEGIRSAFPDSLLRRRNAKGTWNSCRAEFEFKSSFFKLHKHDPKQCDLIICWEHD
ncbi:MAG: winged helix-turn-helix domain-containing protein [Candidatus Tectomicrobia bacterium]|uniref:Winged helix-turn-helix domain-containing protein n=1 Tax=Tectimicrobiota bacterium TaxID=2528274 RepID=A0A933LP87_UNCTE|nr:winged helix-turn-helix domain-containing protein [Candidatus Tectomicrobia bacterium]